MMNVRKQTFAASMVALLAAAPAMAQETDEQQRATDQATTGTTAQQLQNQTTGGDTGTRQQNQTGQQDQAQQQAGQTQRTQQQGDTQQAQDEDGERQMPQAATPEGQGLSDIAGTQGQGQTEFGQGGAGSVVMLDVEGFTEEIYERGFRQGYIRGIADARERFVTQIERAQAARQQGMAAQADRMQSAAGAQADQMPGQTAGQQQGQQQTAQDQGQGDLQQQGDQQMAGDQSGERGTIIVLPPGVTPQAFIQRMMEAHESATQQSQ